MNAFIWQEDILRLNIFGDIFGYACDPISANNLYYMIYLVMLEFWPQVYACAMAINIVITLQINLPTYIVWRMRSNILQFLVCT